MLSRSERQKALSKHIGGHLRFYRQQRGMTQEALAEAVGLKFQQIQKYETGSNRVSAPMLWELSQVLDVPLTAFYDGWGGFGEGDSSPLPAELSLGGQDSRRIVELIRVYRSIPTRKKRRIVEATARSLAEPD